MENGKWKKMGTSKNEKKRDIFLIIGIGCALYYGNGWEESNLGYACGKEVMQRLCGRDGTAQMSGGKSISSQ